MRRRIQPHPRRHRGPLHRNQRWLLRLRRPPGIRRRRWWWIWRHRSGNGSDLRHPGHQRRDHARQRSRRVFCRSPDRQKHGFHGCLRNRVRHPGRGQQPSQRILRHLPRRGQQRRRLTLLRSHGPGDFRQSIRRSRFRSRLRRQHRARNQAGRGRCHRTPVLG